MYEHLTAEQGLQCFESVKKLLYVVSFHSNDGASLLQGTVQSLRSTCWLGEASSDQGPLGKMSG